MRNVASAAAAAATPSHHVDNALASTLSSSSHWIPTKQQQQQQQQQQQHKQHSGGVGTTAKSAKFTTATTNLAEREEASRLQNTETTMSASALSWNEWSTTKSLHRGQVGEGEATTDQSRSDRQIRSATHYENDDHRSSSSWSLYGTATSSRQRHEQQTHPHPPRRRQRRRATLEPPVASTKNDSFQSPNSAARLFPATRSVAQQQPSPCSTSFGDDNVVGSKNGGDANTLLASGSSSPHILATTTFTSPLKQAPSSSSGDKPTTTDSRSKLVQQQQQQRHASIVDQSGRAQRRSRRSNLCERPSSNENALSTRNLPTNVARRQSPTLSSPQRTTTTKPHRRHSTDSRTDAPLPVAAAAVVGSGSRSHEHSRHVQATRQSIDGTFHVLQILHYIPKSPRVYIYIFVDEVQQQPRLDKILSISLTIFVLVCTHSLAFIYTCVP
jgi:hypothetical protein